LSLGELGDTAYDRLHKFGEIYGPVGGLYLGKNVGIIVTGYEALREVFNREDFSHRPKIWQFDFLSDGKALGVFFSNGHLWKEQRRFVLRNLRDFGFGKSSMESVSIVFPILSG
jgi:methyl farnesoate epoxidase/farnesoate epoxidase